MESFFEEDSSAIPTVQPGQHPATTQYPASGLFTVRTRPPFLCARSRHFYELRSIYAYRRFSRANKIRTPWTSRERACSQ
jgi:hypothetical protein